MSEQIVRSYVRVKPDKLELNEEPKQFNAMGAIMLGNALLVVAVVHIGITLAVLLLAGAVYGMKVIYTTPKSVATVEAVTEAPNVPEDKPKRHYQRRITVNHYQLKKPVRV